MDQSSPTIIKWTRQNPGWSMVIISFLDDSKLRLPPLLQSLEIASDTILSGKAKVMIAGGFDDISEEGSYEFANMKATSNAETEFAMGREPTEMSRPATTSHAWVKLLRIVIKQQLIFFISLWNLKCVVLDWALLITHNLHRELVSIS